MLKPTSDRDAAFNVTKQIPALSRETFRTVGEETPRNLPTSKRHKTFGARQNFFGPVLVNKSIPDSCLPFKCVAYVCLLDFCKPSGSTHCSAWPSECFSERAFWLGDCITYPATTMKKSKRFHVSPR